MKKLMIDESGQGMVEYALIIALIAVALVSAVAFFGKKIIASFQDSSTKIQNAK